MTSDVTINIVIWILKNHVKQLKLKSLQLLVGSYILILIKKEERQILHTPRPIVLNIDHKRLKKMNTINQRVVLRFWLGYSVNWHPAFTEETQLESFLCGVLISPYPPSITAGTHPRCVRYRDPATFQNSSQSPGYISKYNTPVHRPDLI